MLNTAQQQTQNPIIPHTLPSPFNRLYGQYSAEGSIRFKEDYQSDPSFIQLSKFMEFDDPHTAVQTSKNTFQYEGETLYFKRSWVIYDLLNNLHEADLIESVNLVLQDTDQPEDYTWLKTENNELMVSCSDIQYKEWNSLSTLLNPLPITKWPDNSYLTEKSSWDIEGSITFRPNTFNANDPFCRKLLELVGFNTNDLNCNTFKTRFGETTGIEKLKFFFETLYDLNLSQFIQFIHLTLWDNEMDGTFVCIKNSGKILTASKGVIEYKNWIPVSQLLQYKNGETIN